MTFEEKENRTIIHLSMYVDSGPIHFKLSLFDLLDFTKIGQLVERWHVVAECYSRSSNFSLFNPKNYYYRCVDKRTH